MPRMTPDQLYNEYRKGFSGCLWEPHIYEELIATSKYAYFKDGAKRIKNSGAGKLSTPFKSVLKFDKSAYKTRQQQGDCVSFATRNACDLTRAVEIDIKGDKESWIALGATEGIYGFRGHGGEGMSCARAATFVSKTGGILLRKNYPGIIDLTKYQPRLSKGWGSRGLPDDIIDLADDHQIRTVSLIRTVEEARDALANGYGLSVCSNYGFSNKRDSKGFARKSGSWNHAMMWSACDDTNGEPAFLIQNSWGSWCSGGHPEWGPIPDGSFLIHADVAEGMLRQNGAYAFSDFNGFPPQKLPDYGFTDYL